MFGSGPKENRRRPSIDVLFHSAAAAYSTRAIGAVLTGLLDEFELKRGSIQKGIAHVIGDNFKGAGYGELLYKNLYLIGLKKDADKPGGIKKKSVISFIGNALLIKNNNPSKGESARTVPFNFTRKPKTTFFSLVWGTIFLGILKTIGLPPSFADKSY